MASGKVKHAISKRVGKGYVVCCHFKGKEGDLSPLEGEADCQRGKDRNDEMGAFIRGLITLRRKILAQNNHKKAMPSRNTMEL